jgi:putative FmdB family regulatory protein
MPMYVFHCKACGHEFEEFVVRVGGKAPCPKCGDKDVENKITAPAACRGGETGHGCGKSAPARKFG